MLNLPLHLKQTNTTARSSWLSVWTSMIDFLSGCHTDEILLSALCQEITIVVWGLGITLPIWCGLCTVSYHIFLRVYHDMYLSLCIGGILVCQCIISALMISVDFVNTDIFCSFFFTSMSLEIAVQGIAYKVTATSSDRQTATQSFNGSRTIFG